MKLLIQLVREIFHFYEKVREFQKTLAVATMSCFLTELRKPIFSTTGRRQLYAGRFASF